MNTLLACMLLTCLAPLPAPARQRGTDGALRQQILDAQERRNDVSRLVDALGSRDGAVARLAALAIGRLERPELAAILASRLGSGSPAVRAEIANAIAQSLAGAASPSATRAEPRQVSDSLAALLARLEVEEDAMVRGVICRTMGRLMVAASELRTVETALTGRLNAVPRPAGIEAAGIAKGLEWLLRTHARDFRAAEPTVAALRIVVFPPRTNVPTRDPEALRARRSAIAALATVPGSLKPAELSLLARRGGDTEVRRLAVRAAGQWLRAAAADRDALLAMLREATRADQAQVRYEAVAAWGRAAGADPSPLLDATSDRNIHVRLLALDLLGNLEGCKPARGSDQAPVPPACQAAIARAAATARQLGARPGAGSASAQASWHAPAHALVSLARLAPDTARPLLGPFVNSRTWQVRTYAARAAAALGDAEVLRALADDSRDNVRTAAVTGLSQVQGHAADAVYVAELERGDYELLMAAARALKGAGTSDAVPALVRALGRVTAERRDTSRDARLAILERIGELGSDAFAPHLAPFTRDFDVVFAHATAALLEKWTGRTVAVADSDGLPHPRLDAAQVARLDGARAVVLLTNGRHFTFALRAWEAPACAVRFAALARAGYYTGLTFHRIVPNFVIQGGSPAANEFVGDGVFWRDEVGLWSNERGTVGLSTRGRDTGDGQFYVNVADNGRLDHSYTVFAAVTEGLDTMDAIVEGDAIRAIRIIERRAARIRR